MITSAMTAAWLAPNDASDAAAGSWKD